MGSFSASLKTIGDREGLPATVNVDNGRLSIDAGTASIGEWALDEIRLEPTPTGYRLAAEGEQLLLDMADSERFADELSKGKKKRPQVKLPSSEGVMRQVDRGLDAAKHRWGSLLPEWVFTRFMFGVVVGALILTIVFPGLVSTFLLLAGVLMVMLGAVVYSDNMLASKWLPGRTTPIHVLIFGVAILMLGVLLGVIAG